LPGAPALTSPLSGIQLRFGFKLGDHHGLLAEAWREVDRDPEIRAAILTGMGERASCAGSDIKEGYLDSGSGRHAAQGGSPRSERLPGLIDVRKPAELMQAEDAVEGAIAFAGKRPPQWQGKSEKRTGSAPEYAMARLYSPMCANTHLSIGYTDMTFLMLGLSSREGGPRYTSETLCPNPTKISTSDFKNM